MKSCVQTVAAKKRAKCLFLRQMTAPKDIRIDDFTYALPDERIAHYPLALRDSSKLLVYDNGAVQHSQYNAIAQLLPAETLLVFNNTKVVQARLHFRKPTGGLVEIFCLEPAGQNDITLAMAQTGTVDWTCMVGGAKKWKEGLLHLDFEIDGKQFNVTAEKIDQIKSAFVIRLCWEPTELSFSEVLTYAGQLPLPPYMNRQAEADDLERYQTVYAKHNGSVAAPTAGLHFTPTVIADLQAKNIAVEYTTLHVGAGTFRPVKADQMADHDMHYEHLQIDADFLVRLCAQKGPIGAVGTTSLRTLESLYWLGVKVAHGHTDLNLHQWEPYELDASNISAFEAIQQLLSHLKKQGKTQLITKTQLLIAPGYQFKMVDILVTNFHQPKSTLLLLVAAFVGTTWRSIYDTALSSDYRFLSYGDGCLLFRSNKQ
jgi:S-adenosylmethionine:tRNA ribosyltransferase-isomerase